MDVATSSGPRAGAARRPVIPSHLLGLMLFVICEAMYFAGLISAYTIVQAGTAPGMWPPPDQPRLPAQSTAFNTAALLLSAVTMFAAFRAHRRGQANARTWLAVTVVLGATFVGLQGVEWVALLRQGMTM